MPLVKPRTTVDCTGLPVYDFSKSFNKEEIGKGAYGAVLTADYPFNAIDDKGQEFRVLGASFSRFRGLRFRLLGASFSRFRGLHFRVLGASFLRFRVFVFKFWVLRFRDLGASCFGLRFRVLRFRNYH